MLGTLKTFWYSHGFSLAGKAALKKFSTQE
jgi:hypothetical protein